MKVKNDHSSKFSNLSNWKEEAWKKIRASTEVTYELFHIFFTPFHSSQEIWTQQIDLALNVWFHSSVGRASHQYSRRSRVRIPVEALIFFRLLLSNGLNWKIYCDDHSSLSSTTAVHIWIISYILHAISLLMGDMNSANWPRSQCVAS